MTTQFPSESDWDAFINDNSLDIEEEESFERFVTERGKNRNSSLAELNQLFSSYQEFALLPKR